VFGDIGQDDVMEVDYSTFTGCGFCQPPPNLVVERLATHIFTDCIAMTWIAVTLIMELTLTDDETYQDRLSKLPIAIDDVPFNLQYHNGPLAEHKQRKRVVTPML
jgi:hypothetical protein